MAPEVICRMNHSFEADYFALGVIIYEMMMGSVPYVSRRDPIWEIQERRFAIKSSHIKPEYQKNNYLWDGVQNPWISSTNS